MNEVHADETHAAHAVGAKVRPVPVSRWFEAVPQQRVTRFAALIYTWVVVDVLFTSSWVRSHAALGGRLYQPLRVSQVLHLPTPSHALAVGLEVVVLGCAAAAAAIAAGRPRRLHPTVLRVLGLAVALSYGAWMLLAMSYGKVDHDRFAFLVALFVLPTVALRARPVHCDTTATTTEAGGFALRCVQVAVVATYFLAAMAKLRFGGLDWPTGAVLERALLRRHTFASGWLIDRPHLLVPMQFAMIGAELISPLALVPRSDRGRTTAAVCMYLFHLGVFIGVTISFAPHCVAVAAFLPLERLHPYSRARHWLRRHGAHRARLGVAPSATVG